MHAHHNHPEMAKPLTREQTASHSEDLQGLINDLDVGALDSTISMRHRMEGRWRWLVQPLETRNDCLVGDSISNQVVVNASYNSGRRQRRLGKFASVEIEFAFAARRAK